MSKEDSFEMEGTVVDTLPNTMFRVELEKWARRNRAYLRQDAQELHPYSYRRQSARRADAL